ncbi:MAG: hypothetical protein QXU32_09300, partial [Nitrososphaerales archaeon]
DHALYEFSKNMSLELVCPITRYEHTDGERLELLHFYDSELGQYIYAWRSVSVKPLIEHINDVFDIDPLPVRGLDKAKSIVLLSVLLY